MVMPFTGTAGYFTRSGAIIGEYNRVAALYGSALDAGFQSIWVQFASSDQAAVQNLPDAVAQYRASDQQYLGVLQGDGALASVLQVSDYYSVVPQTLQESLIVLRQQMIVNAQTIQRATLTTTVTPWGSNIGNAKFITSTKDAFGAPVDSLFAETITATCFNASTPFAEVFQAVGQATVPSTAYNWPQGSGANVQITVSNPATDGMLRDGGFEFWTGTGNNTPVNWTIVDGDAGITVTRGTGGVRGAFTAVLTSDGSQTTKLAQTISATINTVLAVSVQAKVNSADGSGTLVIQITDDNGTVLQDDAGNNLSVSFNQSAQVGISFAIFTGFFSLPRALPQFVRYQVGYGVAPSAAKFMTLDLAGLVIATQLYVGGPYAAAFSQDAANAVGDFYSLAFTNSLTSQSFALGLNRLYNTQSLGIALPSANSPTISDSLVPH